MMPVLQYCLKFSVNNGQVPTSAQAQGNHTYAISFIPKEAKPHIVELKFNGENVPGSPFQCVIVDAAKGRDSPIVKHYSSIKNSCYVTCVNSALRSKR
jgi:hypothetical protein